MNNNTNTNKLFKIVHFGCWNEGGCSTSRNNPLSYVKKELTKLDNKEKIDFYLVAGDNYYQDKQKDKKITEFNEKQFTEGFNCLASLNGHKYILLGNHDTTAIPRYYNTTNIEPKHVCHTIHKEIEFTRTSKYKSKFTMIKPSTTQHLYLPYSKTLFILLDTNLLQSDEDDIKKVLECSIEYYNEYPGEYLTAQDFVNTYIEHLINSTNKYISQLGVDNLDTYFNNLIFVGHHPIYGIKSKQKFGDFKNKGQHFSKAGLDLIINIINMVKPKNVFHLCADIHNYQKNQLVISFPKSRLQNTYSTNNSSTSNNSNISNINNQFVITQFITGTGGAHQDKLPKAPFKNIKIDYYTVNYDITDSKDEGNYGFLFLEELTNGELNFEFKSFNYKEIIISKNKKSKKLSVKKSKNRYGQRSPRRY